MVVRVSKPIIIFHYILSVIPVWYIRVIYKLCGINFTLRLFPARHVYSDSREDIYGNGMEIHNKVFILDKTKTKIEETTNRNVVD